MIFFSKLQEAEAALRSNESQTVDRWQWMGLEKHLVRSGLNRRELATKWRLREDRI